MLRSDDPTPCGVLFDLLKRQGGIPHKELAELILSPHPLPSGKSPRDLARDRTWLSHSVVHAPVGTVPARYFCDFGTAAMRVMSRLKLRRGRAMGAEDILEMLLGEPGQAMDRALARCHEDARLYRNALERLGGGAGFAPGERAESALVLVVAAGCLADVRAAVAYALEYAESSYGRRAGTPTASPVELAPVAAAGEDAPARPLGLLRVDGGYVAGDPHWISPSETGTEIGSLAMGEADVTDVGPGVSGRHARVWREERAGQVRWLVEDLGSKNGSVLVSGADRARRALVPGEPAELLAGDELVLAGTTTFVAIEGVR